MDARQFGLGIVLMLVFMAMQAGWLPFGSMNLLIGAVVFVVVMYLIGKGVMAKPSAEMKELWMFSSALVLVITVIALFVAPLIPGLVVPTDMTAFGALLMSLWMFVFGGAMFVTGWTEKWGVTTLVGILWLFGGLHLSLPFVAQNGYIHFGLLVGLPFIIYGLMSKK